MTTRSFIASRAIIMQDWADIPGCSWPGDSMSGSPETFGPLSGGRGALLKVIERECPAGRVRDSERARRTNLAREPASKQNVRAKTGRPSRWSVRRPAVARRYLGVVARQSRGRCNRDPVPGGNQRHRHVRCLHRLLSLLQRVIERAVRSSPWFIGRGLRADQGTASSALPRTALR